MTAAIIPLSVPLDEYVPACTADPERWTTTEPDEDARAACLVCPRRWLCASEAYQVPGVEGLWAGVVIPEPVQLASSRCVACVRWPNAVVIRFGHAAVAGHAVPGTEQRSRALCRQLGKAATGTVTSFSKRCHSAADRSFAHDRPQR
jgi:hypothetical protein